MRKNSEVWEQATEKTEQEEPESSSAPWETTFPHVIHPRPEESLPSVLLRCDAVNEWPNGTTVRFVYELAGKGATVSHINFAAPKYFPYRECAGGLGIPLSALSATTYLRELQRLFPQSTRIHANWGRITVTMHRSAPSVSNNSSCNALLSYQESRSVRLIMWCFMITVAVARRSPTLSTLRQRGLATTAQLLGTPLPQIMGQDGALQGEYRLFQYYRWFLEQGTDDLIASLWTSVSQWLTQRRLMGLALPDGAFLQASFVQGSVSFSLYRLILALMSIEQQEPDWSVTKGHRLAEIGGDQEETPPK